jgi:DNA-binding NarL/FixJ family response regulator
MTFAPRTTGDPPPTSVWIVEDNPLYRRHLAAAIEQAPGLCCPVVASRCGEALAALDGGLVPDIVLMDIGLPGMDGIEGTRRVRSLSPASRVVMLTVHEEDEKVFAALCAGASGYLLKPAPVEKIVEAIREVVRGGAPVNAYIAAKVLALFARSPISTPRDPAYGLTSREREVLGFLVDGFTMREIAERLAVSYHTVDSHLRNIYARLHVHSRSAAVAKAVREKLF